VKSGYESDERDVVKVQSSSFGGTYFVQVRTLTSITISSRPVLLRTPVSASTVFYRMADGSVDYAVVDISVIRSRTHPFAGCHFRLRLDCSGYNPPRARR
jgi:hypothetical protein